MRKKTLQTPSQTPALNPLAECIRSVAEMLELKSELKGLGGLHHRVLKDAWNGRIAVGKCDDTAKKLYAALKEKADVPSIVTGTGEKKANGAALKRLGSEQDFIALARSVAKPLAHKNGGSSEAAQAKSPQALSSDKEKMIHIRATLRIQLESEFAGAEGIFRGYFGASSAAADAKRWQTKGGEVVDSTIAPKLPYYHTYWAYEAVRKIARDRLAGWAPITLHAIERHFGSGRWLRAIREYSLSDGPQRAPAFAETVRHTARAAELIFLLSPDHRRVSDVAWGLIREADQLQQQDGGWKEFRGSGGSSALWSTLYIHRFLSKLMQPGVSAPDERHAFKREAEPRLVASERFLTQHWHEYQWAPSDDVPWTEGSAAALAEVGQFLKDDVLIRSVYNKLKDTLTPAGRLAVPNDSSDAPAETVQALRLAFGLLSAGRGLAENDSRYRHLKQWLLQSINPSNLSSYDTAFAVSVFGIGEMESAT